MNVRLIIIGVITLVIGLILTTVVSDQTSTIGSSASLGSFAGASALLDLVPLVYVASVVLLAAALMAGGAGRGPLKSMRG